MPPEEKKEPQETPAAAPESNGAPNAEDLAVIKAELEEERKAKAAKRADALLRHETLHSTGDQITIPTNVEQELYDVVTVTDKRCGIDQEKYRVLAIQTNYDRRKGQYEHRLTLGAP